MAARNIMRKRTANAHIFCVLSEPGKDANDQSTMLLIVSLLVVSSAKHVYGV